MLQFVLLQIQLKGKRVHQIQQINRGMYKCDYFGDKPLLDLLLGKNNLSCNNNIVVVKIKSDLVRTC